MGVHVGVLGWAFMYVRYGGRSCRCVWVCVHVGVLGWAFM